METNERPINQSKIWSESDKEYIRTHYGMESAEDIGKALGRSTRTIHQMAFMMGVRAKRRVQVRTYNNN